MRKLRYFLDIEFAYVKDRMILFQRKYVLDLFQETGLMGCKSESTSIDSYEFLLGTPIDQCPAGVVLLSFLSMLVDIGI